MIGDQDKGRRLARRFNAGTVHINASKMASKASPLNDSVKDSGGGRSGHYAVEDSTEVRFITLNHGAGRFRSSKPVIRVVTSFHSTRIHACSACRRHLKNE